MLVYVSQVVQSAASTPLHLGPHPSVVPDSRGHLQTDVLWLLDLSPCTCAVSVNEGSCAHNCGCGSYKRNGGRLSRWRRMRHGDHLPPHKYIRNTSTCGTPPTEHLLNAGRRPQTSQKARKSPCTWVGQKKKGRTKNKRIGMGPAPLGGSCEGGKVSTH